MDETQASEPVADDIVALFERHQKYMSAGRANYAKADKVLDELLERCPVGTSVTIPPKTLKGKAVHCALIDNFADANAVWCGRSMKRFDVSAKAVKPQDTKKAGK